jgi:hypothetical protein
MVGERQKREDGVIGEGGTKGKRERESLRHVKARSRSRSFHSL